MAGIRDGKIRNTEKARRRKNSELNGIRQREREIYPSCGLEGVERSGRKIGGEESSGKEKAGV